MSGEWVDKIGIGCDKKGVIMTVRSFRDLVVWRKAMGLTKLSYAVANQLPKHELYALGDQIRRSAISIPSNIAEGSKRHNSREFLQFCGIALGSSAELETQLLLASDLYDISITKELALIEEVQKMLSKICKQLREKL